MNILEQQEDDLTKMRERILQGFFQATNCRDFSYIPKLYSTSALIHTLSGKQYGAEPILKIFQDWCHSFPDFQLEPLTVSQEEDVIVVHWRFEGIFMNQLREIPPTRKKTVLHGLTCFKCSQGQIIEHWARVDYHPLTTENDA